MRASHSNKSWPVTATGSAPGRPSAEPPVAFRPFLNILRIELVFRFTDVAWLPPFRGSLWRSVLGPALKRLDQRNQWHPPARERVPMSLYDWVFETPVSSSLLSPKTGHVPHPLIIDAPAEKDWVFIPPNQTMRIQLSLVGRFVNAWQAIIAAFRDAGQCGIGRAITREGQRGRAELISVHQVWRKNHRDKPLWNAENGWIDENPTAEFVPPPKPGPVHVELVSPMRIERRKQVVRNKAFCAGDLFLPLIRRTSALMASQAGIVLDVEKERLADQAGKLILHNKNLVWNDVVRWSASQKSPVPSGGITGSFDLEMAPFPELFDFLWLGQWINTGKGAFMGMGNIRLSPL